MQNRPAISPCALLALLLFSAASCLAGEQSAAAQRDYNITPVPFNRVHANDAFWTPRLETNRTVTIPYALQQCVKTDRISNFEKAAGLRSGAHKGIYFNDSDVYKVMEGAAYSLQVHPDRLMRLYLDQLIRIMAAAQWDDGYLFTFYSLPKRQPEKWWTNIESIHELYCVGHMYEAAVAHYQVTGDKTFLDVAVKNADLICDVFHRRGRTDPPGHEEIEVGLCKLYRATGNQKYLDQAKFFLDQRGRKGRRGPDGQGGLYGSYSQDHIPVVEQKKALGHSVRAAYLYTGMADVAALTGDTAYVHAIDAIWNDVVTTKLYITGGIGATGGNEGFAAPYELPNMTAYCETCASIANILWNHRMFLMHGDAKYIDVLERTMLNAALAGISMQGDRFFYPNVLESTGQHARSPWFGCACCPSNVARFIPSIPGFAYAHKGKDVYVNLFLGGNVSMETADNKVTLRQETRYPWEGDVRISVDPEHAERFAVYVRVPGWAQEEPVPSDLYRFVRPTGAAVSIRVNGAPVPVTTEHGYARLLRRWQAGDTIQLHLPMPVRRVVAHRNVAADKGKVALQRGPIVYCLEGPDNEGHVLDLVIPDDTALDASFHPDLLGGVVTVTGTAATAKRTLDGALVPAAKRPFTAIPYYAWAHRGKAPMTVWPARTLDAARPQPAATLALTSKELFVSGQGGYDTYRIPSLVATQQGTLLAFCEGRKTSRSDAGDIDLLLRRSTDGGDHWSDVQVVWDDGPNTCGNPCVVVDRTTGVVWLLLTWNSGTIPERRIQSGFGADSRRVFVTHSKDDGRAWAQPQEITPAVKQQAWSWYATGPGAGIQIARGPHRGRLVIPCDHKAGGDKGDRYYSQPVAKRLYAGSSAYCCLCMIASDQVGCLYEKDDYQRIVLARFPLAWLTSVR